ncbi:hypothetical protein PLICRDRAFT_118405, partial [Plicaturopsis crispa FD-325 SS-3]
IYRRAATAVDLGTAADYSVLTQSGITNVPTSSIAGNIGVSPIDSTAITGFDLILDSSGDFSKSTQVSGNVYAANYGGSTPADLTTAIGDMNSAYTAAAGETPADFTEYNGGAIGGQILTPGIYKWSSGVTIDSDVTLTGTCNDVYVMQIAGTLAQAANTNIILTGGVLASQVFWQVAGGATVGAGANFQGILLSATAVTIETGASVTGRLFSQTNVALQMVTLTEPTAFDASVCNAVSSTVTATVGTATVTDFVRLQNTIFTMFV